MMNLRLVQLVVVIMHTQLVVSEEHGISNVTEQNVDDSWFMPGVFSAIEGEDVLVNTKYGRILGKRRNEVENIGTLKHLHAK